MAIDEFKEEKKQLTSAKNNDAFVYAAKHLLLQDLPELTEFVRTHEDKLVAIALEPSPKPKARIDAIKALETLQSSQVAQLSALLTERSVALVTEAARVLGGKLKSPTAVQKLVALVKKEGDWSPQYDALKALRYFDDPQVVPTHLEALNHAQPAIRREALNGLAHVRAPEGVPHWLTALQGKDGQHMTVAARALSEVDSKEAKAALKDAKIYAHALKRSKDLVDGRFTVGALSYFQVPTVEDDLVALVKKSDDAEVVEGAISGLARRNAQHALPEVATWAFKKDDASYYGGHVVSLLHALAKTFAPDAGALKSFIAVAEKVKTDALTELAESTEQWRYQLDRVKGEGATRLEAWRVALGKAKKNKAELVLLLTSPRDV